VSYQETQTASGRCYKIIETFPEVLEAYQRRKNRVVLQPGQAEYFDIRDEMQRECMEARGFIWRVLEEYELPLCSSVGPGTLCRNEVKQEN
jgi:hypothetical protein